MSGQNLFLLPDRPEGVRYTFRERAWHWIQTLLLLSLPLTGFAIHFPEYSGPLVRFSQAVAWHSRLGALLWANLALGLIYYAVAGRWPNVLPAPGDFTSGALRLLRHYFGGAWRGEPHPFETEGSSPLVPLAKVSYGMLLLVLIPFQMATGALIWCGDRLMFVPAGYLGLPILGPAHTLGGYLFVAFLFLHVYLTALGPGTGGRLRAMFTGRVRRRSA